MTASQYVLQHVFNNAVYFKDDESQAKPTHRPGWAIIELLALPIRLSVADKITLEKMS